MAPQHALAALLTLASTAYAQSFSTEASTTGPSTLFWTYTSRFMPTVTTSVYTNTRYSSSSYTYTSTTVRAVLPNVTPKSASPTSTSTSSYYYNDIKYVYEYYAPGAFAESELAPARDYYASTTATSMTTETSLTLYMPVTLSAPASCPTPFAITTTTRVSVPSIIIPQITPTSTQAGSVTTRYGTEVTSYGTWWLSAGAAPFTTTSNYDYKYYVASCTVPYSARTSSPRSGGGSSSGGSSSDDSDFCYYRYYSYCGDGLKIYIIIIASVIPGLFLLGFLESWFWFRRLMNGKSAMRFGTCCWVLISLWVLCFTRMQDARSKEDQKVLQEKWKNMGSGAAFKAWWKWGFRHKYPVEHLGQYSKMTVGIVPAGQPVHPEMAQAPPVFAPGAPPPAFQPGAPNAPPGAPGQHGSVFYYGPPPAGWVPTPDGQGFMPPQGYNYPPPQQAGYYGADVPKAGTTVSSSPVSALGPQQQFPAHQQGQPPVPGQSPPQAQAPQPVHHNPTAAQMPTPTPPPQSVSPVAPAPAVPAPAPQQAPPAPPANVNEAPANPARQPPKNDPNDRSLYE